MKYNLLEKTKVGELVKALKKKYRVVGPKEKENLFIYGDIEDAEELKLEHKPPILSLKKYYLPQEEPLLTFKFKEAKAAPVEVKKENLIIFGAHTCDITGIICLDNASSMEPRDSNFLKRKKHTLIIGVECLQPCDEHATCVTMGTHNPKGGFDLMLTDSGNKYIVQVNSIEGENLINENKFLFKESDAKSEDSLIKMRQEKEKWPRKLKVKIGNLKKTVDASLKHKEWESVKARCVSCGNCTNVCPTCYCFDIKDDVDLNLANGTRSRIWDSCQLKEFAEVTGGESFRKDRKSRQQHRFLRKFSYSVERYNRFFCTGCGRCTRACMAKISLYETMNNLAKE
ncbi:MAG: 4Fe-4S dicluster domain-containing protein [Candidatus Firestonebacteria bacterium]